MAALFAWIIRGVSYAGPAAIGYFFNDVATWVSSLMPTTNVRDKRGGFAWWFVMALFVALGAAVLMILKMFGGKKLKL